MAEPGHDKQDISQMAFQDGDHRRFSTRTRAQPQRLGTSTRVEEITMEGPSSARKRKGTDDQSEENSGKRRKSKKKLIPKRMPAKKAERQPGTEDVTAQKGKSRRRAASTASTARATRSKATTKSIESPVEIEEEEEAGLPDESDIKDDTDNALPVMQELALTTTSHRPSTPRKLFPNLVPVHTVPVPDGEIPSSPLSSARSISEPPDWNLPQVENEASDVPLADADESQANITPAELTMIEVEVTIEEPEQTASVSPDTPYATIFSNSKNGHPKMVQDSLVSQPRPSRARRATKPPKRYGMVETPPVETFEIGGMTLEREEFADVLSQEQGETEKDPASSLLKDAPNHARHTFSAESTARRERLAERRRSLKNAQTSSQPSAEGPELLPNRLDDAPEPHPEQQALPMEDTAPVAVGQTNKTRPGRLKSVIRDTALERQMKARSSVGSHVQTALAELLLPSQYSQKESMASAKTMASRKRSANSVGGLPSPASSHPDSAGDDVFTPFPDEPALDPRLGALSDKLMQRQKDPELKPPPQGEPLVWADSRQALNETVPYFKMPQSGCHQNDHHVYAFLFDGHGHDREYMDTDVIISRAGGSMEQGTGDKKMVQKQDHRMNESQVQAVLNDIDLQNPLVIICGSKSEGTLTKMPHRYNVMGWYKPVLLWAEKSEGKGKKNFTTIKYRFERLNAESSAWHAPPTPLLTEEERRSAGPLESKSCTCCQIQYPRIYLVGWMCLNSDCDGFWKLPDGSDAPCGKLHYNPAFLLSRTPWQNEEEPYSVRPPVRDVGKFVGDNLTHINTRGICCPDCGRCSQRRLLKGWKCDNPECHYENFPKHIPVTVPQLHQPWEGIGDGPSLARNKHERSQGVSVSVSHKFGFKIYTYTFDGIDGKFVHAVSNAKINRLEGGPDDMFAAMQNQDDPEMDLHLERRQFKGKRGADSSVTKARRVSKAPKASARRQTAPADFWREVGEAADEDTSRRQTIDATTAEQDIINDEPVEPDEEGSTEKTILQDGDLMTAFAINFGMPYKFVASGASLPFTNAPWPVRACRADLNWASQTFLSLDSHTDFNELLIFAYMQGQKIEYHDDGETGLGPRIATLSLGGKATMHLRMKTKHYAGCSKTGILTAQKPIPGCLSYQARLEAWERIQPLKQTNSQAYEAARKQIPKDLDLVKSKNKLAKDLVTITLNHGDIVLMEGDEIQQYLEHKVVPEGVLRFALTCRTVVMGEHLKEGERPEYEVGGDEVGMSSLRRMAEGERGEVMEGEAET